MAATASEVFEFLDEHPLFAAERHEISLTEFDVLRHSLRSIVVNLHEGGDHEADESASRLRNLLSEWLTVPVPFDGRIVAVLQEFGAPAEIEARWGHEIGIAFDSARKAAQSLQLVENPVRASLLSVIRELRLACRPFKIYCYRTARADFESLFIPPGDAPLEHANFLHSVRDYRDTETFDTLIKVGPLRSWGWGSAPDAIKSAPRFGTLVQIVWAGCGDTSGFGYDPVAPSADGVPTFPTVPAEDNGSLGNRISWTPHITRFGHDVAGAAAISAEEDDFKIFGRLNEKGMKRHATLLQIDGEHGILYPPHSQVLSFDPAPQARASLWRRLPGEALLEGMFVIRPLLGDVDLGEQQAGHGHYSGIWKARLAEERRSDLNGLLTRLRGAGLNLVCLLADIRNWCVAPTTVIHAPHKRKHFEILIQVLGLAVEENGEPRQQGVSWAQRAWNEIRHSRGDAIQAGLHGQEIVDDQLMTILNGILAEIRRLAAHSDGFALALPAGQALHGAALFNKLIRVEDGFLAPDTELRVVRELNTLQQWHG